MISEWSQDLALRFTCAGQAVENLVVHLLLVSNRKNSFPLGPFVTDQRGEIQVTRDSMASTVAVAKSEFPMDYDGTLADCTGVEIIIESDIGLRERIERLQQFYPDEAGKLSSLVSGSANQRFGLSRFKVENSPDGVVEIPLTQVYCPNGNCGTVF